MAIGSLQVSCFSVAALALGIHKIGDFIKASIFNKIFLTKFFQYAYIQS
jgi:hypothetical protein